MAMSIEEGIREMLSEGESKLSIYWLEDIKDGDIDYWLDIHNDTLGEICSMNWIWDVISKTEIENDDDPDSSYGDLESDIIVDDPFSEAVVKSAIEGWLKDRELDIWVEIISPDGTVAEKRILDSIKAAENEMGIKL